MRGVLNLTKHKRKVVHIHFLCGKTFYRHSDVGNTAVVSKLLLGTIAGMVTHTSTHQAM